MEFTVQRSDFLELLSRCMKAGKGRPSQPVLSGLKLNASRNHVIGLMYNGNFAVESVVPAKVKEDGRALLPVRQLNEIVKRMPGDELNVLMDDVMVEFSSGTAVLKLGSMDSEVYPTMPRPSEATLSLPADLLREMLSKTMFAASKDNPDHPLFTGVHIHTHDDELVFEATDGFRLAKKSTVMQETLPSLNIVVPGSHLAEMNALLPEDDTPVFISMVKSYLVAEWPAVKFYSRLLDGAYPDVNRLLPKNAASSVSSKTAELLDGLNRAVVLSRGDDNNRIRWSVKAGVLTSISRDKELGELVEEFSIQLDGPELNIAFNGLFLKDAMQALNKGSSCLIEFAGGSAPMVIRSREDPLFVQLVSPVRTR